MAFGCGGGNQLFPQLMTTTATLIHSRYVILLFYFNTVVGDRQFGWSGPT